MKTFAFFAVSFATVFSSLADTSYKSSPENYSPQLSTNTPIIWQAVATNLPKRIWTYRRIVPYIFQATVISNAIVLASFQNRGFPQPSTNNTCIVADPDCHCSCAQVCNFFISPASATISFFSPEQSSSTAGIPSDASIVMRGWNCAFQLGIDSAHVVEKNLTFRFNSDTNGEKLPNQICGRGVYLSRQLDGICFWGNGDDSLNEGFWIEFGSYGQIRSFSFNWPNLEHDKSQQTASMQQIIACIRAQKTIVIPNSDEGNYFQRVKALANAKKFIITKITPYFSEGVFGEVPTNDEPAKIVAPIAELEAVADFGNSNATVRLLSPILSSEVVRLLGK